MLLKNKLIDLCMAEESGQYGVPYPAEEYDSSKYRYLRITDISDDGCLLDNDLKSVSGDNIDSYILSENDIVFARTGNSTGRSYLYDKRHGLLVYAGFLIRYKIDQSKINPKYLHYFTNSSYYKQWVKNLSNGSTRGNINAQTFADCDIIYPSRQQQDILVNTLSAIDEKISLNTRMNAELEAMAKQLYEYWFVQFDFPDENGKPYKSSGGEMVYNSTLKREIPAGWEVKNLNKIADSFRGVTYNKSDLVSESEDSILVLRGNNIPSSGQFAYDSNVAFIPRAMISEEQKINKGDIIITMSSGSKEHIGKCFMFQSDSDHTFGAFLSKFVPSNDRRYYVYLSMLSEFFKAFVKTTCNGTGINNLTNDTFNNVLFPIPNSKTLREFENITESIYKKVGVNQKQINDLTHLRDSLLPMLMNGQVTVE